MKTPAPFTVGQRVRWSGNALRPRRDSWLLAGRSSDKSHAKDELDRMAAERGTVTDCQPGKYTAWTVNVRTDSGHEHNSLPYLWEDASELAGQTRRPS